MTEVKIKNFQSVGEAAFEVKGFTVVVGKNNLGKSALVRAIDSALTNQTGKEFIRHGEKNCEVSIKQRGLDITWHRGDSSSYVVNGEKFTKLNRAIPDPILKAGFRRLEVGDQKLNPLVAKQFDELFLLDRPGSAITEVLSAVYKLNILSTADDLCRKELREQKSLLKTRNKDLAAIEGHLEEFKDFDGIKKCAAELQKNKEKCEQIRVKIQEIQDYCSRIETLKKKLKTLEEMAAVKIPDCEALSKKVNDLSWMEEIHGNLISTASSVKSMQEIVRMDIPAVTGVETKVQALREVCELHTSLRDVAQGTKKHKDLLAELVVLDSILLPGLQKTEALVEKVRQIKSAAEEFTPLVISLKAMKQELSNAETELDKLKKEEAEYKICPLCRKPL